MNFRLFQYGIIIFGIISGFAPFLAHAAGGIATGGGQGVVCRDRDHQIVSVELLDLWEARVRYRRKIVKSDAPADEQAYAALDRLKHINRDVQLAIYSNGNWIFGYDAYREALWETVKKLRDLKGDGLIREGSLALTHDSYEDVLPPEAGRCKKEQIIRYADLSTDPDPVLMNEELFEKMDETNKAALFVHEAYYKSLRERGEASSIRVRRAVGLVFSGYTFPSLESLLPKSYYQCVEEETPFEEAYSAKTRINLFSQATSNPLPKGIPDILPKGDELNVVSVQIEAISGHSGTGFALNTSRGPGILDPKIPLVFFLGNYETSMGDERVAFDHVAEISAVPDENRMLQIYAQLKSAPGLSGPLPKVKLHCRAMDRPLDPWEIQIPGINAPKK